jgi:hypothetical protein
MVAVPHMTANIQFWRVSSSNGGQLTGFQGGSSSNDGHLLGLWTAYRTQFLNCFQGMYCFHIQSDWIGVSSCWTDTEEEIYWLDWVTSGCLASTTTGGEARVEGCSKPMETWKGGCSWKSNYQWLRNLTTIGSENSYPLPSPCSRSFNTTV